MPLSTPYLDSPFASANEYVQRHELLPEPILTEVAQKEMMTLPQTPLKELFPDESIDERVVVFQHDIDPVASIWPFVQPGRPDVIVNDQGGVTISRIYNPFYIRRSFALSWEEVNHRIRPGSGNERWSPAEQIALRIRRELEGHEMTWNVYRALMLLGGIDRTDPLTGFPVQMSSFIQPHNVFTYNITEGFDGRNEANIFRTTMQSQVSGVVPGAVPWTDADAAIVDFFYRIKRWNRMQNKTELTDVYVSEEMFEVMCMNNEIRTLMGATLYRPGTVAGDTTLDNASGGGGATVLPQNAFLSPRMTKIGIDTSTGDLLSIAGINIKVVQTYYKDTDGTIKFVWPKNKVVFVAGRNMQGQVEPIGRTQYCIGESSEQRPGLWTREDLSTRIPNAPGMAMQMGNAGAPYIKYPNRVLHVTACSVDDIDDKQLLIPDISYGLF